MQKLLKSICTILLMLILLGSCSEPNIESKPETETKAPHLRLQSSITHLAKPNNAKTTRNYDYDNDDEGGKIIGVILDFHDGQGIWYGLHVDDPLSFYLAELKNPVVSDSYAYNYVLLVPSVVRTEYEEGNGKSPQTGNPFWWYMHEYFGLNLGAVLNDWEDVLELLLENRDELPYPDRKDIVDFWSMDHEKFWKKIKHLHYSNPDQISNDFSSKGFYFATEAGKSAHSKYDANTLFLPIAIKNEYIAGGGNMFAFVEAMLWYFKDFCNMDEDALWTMLEDGTFADWVKTIDYSANPADGRKLKLRHPELVYDELKTDADRLFVNGASYFYPESILDGDTRKFADPDKIHFMIFKSKQGKYFFNVYLPMCLIEEYEATPGHSRHDFNIWSWYVENYHHLDTDTINDYENHGYPVDALEKLVEFTPKTGK